MFNTVDVFRPINFDNQTEQKNQSSHSEMALISHSNINVGIFNNELAANFLNIIIDVTDDFLFNCLAHADQISKSTRTDTTLQSIFIEGINSVKFWDQSHKDIFQAQVTAKNRQVVDLYHFCVLAYVKELYAQALSRVEVRIQRPSLASFLHTYIRTICTNRAVISGEYLKMQYMPKRLFVENMIRATFYNVIVHQNSIKSTKERTTPSPPCSSTGFRTPSLVHQPVRITPVQSSRDSLIKIIDPKRSRSKYSQSSSSPQPSKTSSQQSSQQPSKTSSQQSSQQPSKTSSQQSSQQSSQHSPRQSPQQSSQHSPRQSPQLPPPPNQVKDDPPKTGVVESDLWSATSKNSKNSIKSQASEPSATNANSNANSSANSSVDNRKTFSGLFAAAMNGYTMPGQTNSSVPSDKLMREMEQEAQLLSITTPKRKSHEDNFDALDLPPSDQTFMDDVKDLLNASNTVTITPFDSVSNVARKSP